MNTNHKLNMKVIIRPVRFLDINEMILVNQSSLAENYNKEYWVQKYHEGKSHTFVATVSDIVIGYILCDGLTIISFAISEKYRFKGIGRQLICNCLNTCDKTINLHVRVTNENALKLYKSLGFTEKERLNDYYVSPVDGAFIMEWIPTGVVYKASKKLNITVV